MKSPRPELPVDSMPDAENRPLPSSSKTARATSKVLLTLAIILVSANLRPVLTSLGPVLESVRSSLNMSPTAIGVLLALPILCFGAFAPLTPRLLRYQTIERLILQGLLILALGIGLRSLFGVAGLFIGTLIAGASISVIMVLVPTVIKRDFPRQASHMMGLYSMALVLGAAIAAGATVPLEQAMGGSWRWALAFWLLPAILAALLWQRQVSGKHSAQAERVVYSVPRLRGSWLAWQVTLYLGLQSAQAYLVFGWLPPILIDRGVSPLTAGFMVSASIAIQLITALSGPWLATRGRDQRSVMIVMMALTLIGMMGCLYGPISVIWPWIVLLGLGQGGNFSIALALLVLRARDPGVSAALSGMAQGVGYTLAALGPLAVGLLHEHTQNWHSTAILFVVVGLVALAAGLGAGRTRYI